MNKVRVRRRINNSCFPLEEGGRSHCGRYVEGESLRRERRIASAAMDKGSRSVGFQ